MGSLLGDNNVKLEVSVNKTSIIYLGITILLAVAVGAFIAGITVKKI